MAAVAAAALHANGAERKVDLVVNDDDRFVRHLVEGAQGRRWRTRAVHEALWLGEHDRLAAHRDRANASAELIAITRPLPATREAIHDKEPGVVPGPFVPPSRVAEAEDEVHPYASTTFAPRFP